MRSLTVLAALLVGLAAACTDDRSAPPALDAGSDGPPADAADPTVVESRRAQIGPLTIAPGQEATVCLVVDLGNAAPRMVREERSDLTDGMHYLNAGDQPLAIGGTVTLELADAGAALAPVALTFTGNSAISIAAHTTAHLTSEHALPAGTRLFATTAHTHQWGRRATVELLRTAGDPSPLVLHDSTDWADRPLDQFAPITVGPDARLRLTCDFDNQSNQTVNFGLSAEDEMCFLWAHHVPQ